LRGLLVQTIDKSVQVAVDNGNKNAGLVTADENDVAN
jgi:hypothetical protein